MTDLHVTLITDGPSDRLLLSHLRWLLVEHLRPEIAIQQQWADLRTVREKPAGLQEKLRAGLHLYPCDLLLIHRDAEKESPSHRYDEIRQAAEGLDVDVPPFVSVVPVRMTEAWLLFDEQAVRHAAGNPNGRESLPIPIGGVEHDPDPKQTLQESLQTASGLSGRRRKKFNTNEAVHRVAEYIDDFSPLRALSAFRKLEEDLARVIRKQGWGP